jgi:hypothetical protein
VRDGFGGEGRASLLRDARQNGPEGCLSAPAYRKSCRKIPHPNVPFGVTILAGT